jgi:hypothetical protein
MRIVYDDAQQEMFVSLVAELMWHLDSNMHKVVRYEWGMDRVQQPKVKERIQGFVEDYGFDIGNTVTHAHGIGNNCMYPVYYYTMGETQHCANININSGMYGEVYVSVEDYNGKRVGGIFYELTRNGVTKKKIQGGIKL